MEGFHFRRTFQVTLDHPEGKAVTTYSSTRYLWCPCNARAQPSHECTYPDSLLPSCTTQVRKANTKQLLTDEMGITT